MADDTESLQVQQESLRSCSGSAFLKAACWRNCWVGRPCPTRGMSQKESCTVDGAPKIPQTTVSATAGLPPPTGVLRSLKSPPVSGLAAPQRCDPLPEPQTALSLLKIGPLLSSPGLQVLPFTLQPDHLQTWASRLPTA